MHNFEAQVSRMVDNLQVVFSDRILADGNFYVYPNKPKVSDIELLAISSVAESFSINSENSLFTRLGRECPGLLTGRITRPRFNIRRRSLNIHMEDYLQRCHKHLIKDDSSLIVDSTPLPICKLGRLIRLKACKDNPLIRPQLAVCHAKKEAYYGFKMQLITTQNHAFPVAFSITSSRVHDVKALEAMIDEMPDLNERQILGDKGYISNPLQLHLFENKRIELNAQPRNNMKTPLNWTAKMGAIRRRIETVFSQVHDQFRLGQNFAKTFNGLVTRITHKLAGILFCKLTNIQNGRSANLVKSALFC
jgi:Transposase DDE domain